MGGSGGPHSLKQFRAGLWVRGASHRHKGHGGLTMTGKDNLIPRLRPSHEIGQLAFGVGHGNSHLTIHE